MGILDFLLKRGEGQAQSHVKQDGISSLNGVRLPKAFDRCGAMINNMAITGDGSQYAIVSSRRKLLTGEVPPSGQVSCGDDTLNVTRTEGGHVVVEFNGIECDWHTSAKLPPIPRQG